MWLISETWHKKFHRHYLKSTITNYVSDRDALKLQLAKKHTSSNKKYILDEC